MRTDEPYSRGDLAYVHHQGYRFHADACAPGILASALPPGGLIAIDPG
jgi:hypothetical protein